MQKTVSAGERITTVTLDGTECEVIFDRDYPYFYIANLGSGAVSVAQSSGIPAGGDGSLTIAAGNMLPLSAGLSQSGGRLSTDRLYLFGSGDVQIYASQEQLSGFKFAGKGGENGAGENGAGENGAKTGLLELLAVETGYETGTITTETETEE